MNRNAEEWLSRDGDFLDIRLNLDFPQPTDTRAVRPANSGRHASSASGSAVCTCAQHAVRHAVCRRCRPGRPDSRRKGAMSTTAHLPTAALAERSAASYAERNARYWRRNLAVCVFESFTTLVSLSMLFAVHATTRCRLAVGRDPVVGRLVQSDVSPHGRHRAAAKPARGSFRLQADARARSDRDGHRDVADRHRAQRG
ncbi:hypothetical protein BCEP4_430027 [Burkholderia cepacia]|nr:hypothetical protein BCEP4_430027 [Burkholderia cepacia]